MCIFSSLSLIAGLFPAYGLYSGTFMDNNIFIKQIGDIYKLSDKYACSRFSHFLNSHEKILLNNEGLANGVLFGGYDDAERCVLGVFPEWYEMDFSDFPIKVIKFTKKYERELTHRDFLGTALSLGIERNRIGDILVDNPFSYMFVFNDVADFVCRSITKIANCGVKAEIADIKSIKLPERTFKIIETVAASLRLDAVIAAGLNISRKKARGYIEAGKVSVNHTEEPKIDAAVMENDLLSIRGFGRMQFLHSGNKTRSDRIHIILKKYI